LLCYPNITRQFISILFDCREIDRRKRGDRNSGEDTRGIAGEDCDRDVHGDLCPLLHAFDIRHGRIHIKIDNRKRKWQHDDVILQEEDSIKQQHNNNKVAAAAANDSSNTETTFTFKLGRSNGRSSSNVASSESSDPLESDYSEEDAEQEQRKPDPATNSRSSSTATTTTTSSADHDNDVDEEEEEDDEDEEEGNGRDADEATHDSSESIEEDDGNETDDEEDDDESEESSSVQTAKGVRKYHLDDYQIIKTVGKSDAVYTGPPGVLM